MKTFFLFSVAFSLCACSMPTHLSEMYYPSGKLAKREFDTNPSIGGVHSQKGADGYQADDDNQQSLRDVVTAVSTGYSVGQTAKTTINGANNVTKQQKNASDAALALQQEKDAAAQAASDATLKAARQAAARLKGAPPL